MSSRTLGRIPSDYDPAQAMPRRVATATGIALDVFDQDPKESKSELVSTRMALIDALEAIGVPHAHDLATLAGTELVTELRARCWELERREDFRREHGTGLHTAADDTVEELSELFTRPASGVPAEELDAERYHSACFN